MLKSEGHAELDLPFAGPRKAGPGLPGHYSKKVGPNLHRKADPHILGRDGLPTLHGHERIDPDGLGVRIWICHSLEENSPSGLD